MTIEEINKKYGIDLYEIQKNEMAYAIEDCNETKDMPELIKIINSIHHNYKYLQNANKLFEFNEFNANPFENDKNTFSYIYGINRFIEKVDFYTTETKQLFFVKIDISFQENSQDEYKYIFCNNDLKDYKSLKDKIIENHKMNSLKTIKDIKIDKKMIMNVDEIIEILKECTNQNNYIIDNSIKSLNKSEGIKHNDCFVFNKFKAFDKFMR